MLVTSFQFGVRVVGNLVPDCISVPPTLFDVATALELIVDSLFCQASGHFLTQFH